MTAACIVVLAAAAWLGAATCAEAASGLEIMRKQRELHRTRDEEDTQVLTLVSRTGATKERRLVVSTLRAASGLDKILIRFTAPRDIENSALLTWEAPDGDDDQWLYLPAVRKPKRIAPGARKSRFMGTDFSYEDLRPEALGLHHYTVVGTERLEGHETWVIEAGPATERQAADSGYSKRRLWVRTDTYVTVKREYYDRHGRLEKVETFRKLAPVRGSVWRAGEAEMHDVQAGTRTLVRSEQRRLDSGLREALFSEAELAR